MSDFLGKEKDLEKILKKLFARDGAGKHPSFFLLYFYKAVIPTYLT